MKNLLIILGVGTTLLMSCSSSNRMGYTYYDDVYDNRPSYAEDRRKSATVDDRPVYQQPSTSSRYQTEYIEDSRYIDDEQQNTYGTYTERIRRFNNSSSGFDYYSPYYTGYNDGFNYGIGIGSGMMYSNYGRWGSSMWNPWYSSSISFGWGRPAWGFGLSSWYTPSFYDPFYNYQYGWGRPWYNSYHNNGWGSPWGWGNNHIDRNPRNNNSHYGPRGSSYGNQYYNGNQYQGGKMNNSRGSDYNTPNRTPSNNGNMRYTPKTNTPQKSNPSVRPTPSPERKQPQPSQPNIPNRYNQPSQNTPSPQQRSAPSPSNPGNSGGRGTMQKTNK